jgi:hypothetical protein
MQNVDWLFENANVPIKYCITEKHKPQRKIMEDELLKFPEVSFWLNILSNNAKVNSIKNIHGSHDYRYENIMGKLTQLGLNREISIFDRCCTFYLKFLDRQIRMKRDKDLTISKLYSFYDYELLIVTFLSLAGYVDAPAVQYVIQKRISLLYEFTKERRYDIYIDGSRYPGVKKEWQPFIIDPSLYDDGNIHFPTIHDYFLFSVSIEQLNTQLQTKIDTIVNWLFDEQYEMIKRNYGYFYVPGGAYSTKAICFKFNIPNISENRVNEEDIMYLLQRVYILSHFKICNYNDWFKKAIDYLKTFRNETGRYEFPRKMLTEKRDTYWIFSGHMGMGENRRKKPSNEIESTYWMEKTLSNLNNK